MTDRNHKPRRFARLLWSLLFLIVLAAGVFWLTHQPTKPAMASPPGIPVVFGVVQEQSTDLSADYLAQVNNDASITLHPQVASRIRRVFIQDGQYVKQGQPLFLLDADPQAATVRSLAAAARSTQAEAPVVRRSIASLQTDRNAALADLQFNQTQLGRYQQLAATQSVSRRDVEQFQTTVADLQQKLKSLDAQIQGQQARLGQIAAATRRDMASMQQAQALLGYYAVRAPFTGWVGQVIAKTGDVVDPTTVLTTLTDNRRLKIEVALPADQLNRAMVGRSLDLFNTAKTYVGQARIYGIAPRVDSQSQTILVKALANNRQGWLHADEHLHVRLTWGRRPTLQVPIESVLRLAGQPFVYRIEAAKASPAGHEKPMAHPPVNGPSPHWIAHLQTVTLGGSQANNVIITNGLHAGERIVTHGIQKLQDGAPIVDLATLPPPAKPAHH